jgi:hypothetical protein
MKCPFRVAVLCVALLAPFGPNRAFAAGSADGGTAGDVAVEGGAPSDDGGLVADDASDDGAVSGGTSGGVPLGCDGALCATTTGGTTCSTAEVLGSTRAAFPTALALLLGMIGFGTLRRRARPAKERVR